MAVSYLISGIAAAFVVTTIGLLIIYLTANHRDTIARQQQLFLVAMTIRFAAALVLHETSLYEVVIGSADASGWHLGRVFKERIDESPLGPLAIPQELLDSVKGINRGYGTFLGLYFYVTRLCSELSASAFSCFAGAMTAVFSYRLARVIFSENVAIKTGWLVCVFPSMLIWSIQTIKEPLVILLEIVAMYACTVLRETGFSARHIALWMLSAVAVLPLRFYAAYMLCGVIVVSLFVPNLNRRSAPFGTALVFGIILLCAINMASDSLEAHQEKFESFDVGQVQNFRQAVTVGEGSGSGVVLGYDMRTGGGFLIGTLVGALHLLLAPFPWQFGGGSVRFALTAPEMIVWWLLVLGGLVRGVAHGVRHKPGAILPIMLFIIILGTVYSMMFGNIGIIYRQRAQLLPYLFMLTMFGFETARATRSAPSYAEELFETIGPPSRVLSSLEIAPCDA